MMRNFQRLPGSPLCWKLGADSNPEHVMIRLPCRLSSLWDLSRLFGICFPCSAAPSIPRRFPLGCDISQMPPQGSTYIHVELRTFHALSSARMSPSAQVVGCPATLTYGILLWNDSKPIKVHFCAVSRICDGSAFLSIMTEI